MSTPEFTMRDKPLFQVGDTIDVSVTKGEDTARGQLKVIAISLTQTGAYRIECHYLPPSYPLPPRIPDKG